MRNHSFISFIEGTLYCTCFCTHWAKRFSELKEGWSEWSGPVYRRYSFLQTDYNTRDLYNLHMSTPIWEFHTILVLSRLFQSEEKYDNKKEYFTSVLRGKLNELK